MRSWVSPLRTVFYYMFSNLCYVWPVSFSLLICSQCPLFKFLTPPSSFCFGVSMFSFRNWTLAVLNPDSPTCPTTPQLSAQAQAATLHGNVPEWAWMTPNCLAQGLLLGGHNIIHEGVASSCPLGSQIPHSILVSCSCLVVVSRNCFLAQWVLLLYKMNVRYTVV